MGSLLQNAFIRALVPKVDDKVTIEKVPEPAKEHPGEVDTNAPPVLPPKEVASEKGVEKQ